MENFYKNSIHKITTLRKQINSFNFYKIHYKNHLLITTSLFHPPLGYAFTVNSPLIPIAASFRKRQYTPVITTRHTTPKFSHYIIRPYIRSETSFL